MQKIIGTSNINSVKYYACGYCMNNLHFVFKKYPKEIRKFPAGVFLIEHREKGYILVDTGYAVDMFDKGIIPKLYKLFNPTFCNEEDEIANQLKKEGISSDMIKHIILTHLHPDHIGCLGKFKNAKFYISEELYDEYKKRNLKSLIFESLIPEDFEERLQFIKFPSSSNETEIFKNVSVIKLDGHAKGQIGVFMKNENILLAADSCWGKDLLESSKRMKITGKLIQNNVEEYKQTIDILEKLQKEKVNIYFSHDKIDRKELL